MMNARSDFLGACERLVWNNNDLAGQSGRFLYEMIKSRVRTNKEGDSHVEFLNALYYKTSRFSKDDRIEVVADIAVNFDFEKYNSSSKQDKEIMISDFIDAYKKRGAALLSLPDGTKAHYKLSLSLMNMHTSENLTLSAISWCQFNDRGNTISQRKDFYRKLPRGDDINAPCAVRIRNDGTIDLSVTTERSLSNTTLPEYIVDGDHENAMILLEEFGNKHDLTKYNTHYGTHPLLALLAKGYNNCSCERMFKKPYDKDMTYRIAEKMLSLDPSIVNLPHLKTGDTPAHIAAAYGDIRLLKLLESHGADLTIANQEGHTAKDVLNLHTPKEAYELISRVASPNQVNLLSNNYQLYKDYSTFNEERFNQYRESNMNRSEELLVPAARHSSKDVTTNSISSVPHQTANISIFSRFTNNLEAGLASIRNHLHLAPRRVTGGDPSSVSTTNKNFKDRLQYRKTSQHHLE